MVPRSLPRLFGSCRPHQRSFDFAAPCRRRGSGIRGCQWSARYARIRRGAELAAFMRRGPGSRRRADLGLGGEHRVERFLDCVTALALEGESRDLIIPAFVHQAARKLFTAVRIECS